MKVNREKLQLAMARACMSSNALAEAAGMPRPTLDNAICGRNVRTDTIGRVARALNVDVTEIMEKEV